MGPTWAAEGPPAIRHQTESLALPPRGSGCYAHRAVRCRTEESSMRQRQRSGSVVLDKRIKTWNFFFWDNGRRRSKKIGTTKEYPTKASAWRAAQPLRQMVENQAKVSNAVPAANNTTVKTLVELYRTEKMPKRKMTRQGYNTWLNHYIVPTWGNCTLQELQARPIDLWLQSLALAPKSKVHIRGLVRALWEFAMWRGDVPTQRNPMELVTIKGATKRVKMTRSLTVEEFQRLLAQLEEPFRTMALVCACLGLRISECLALRWSDVDWLNGTLCVERGIVHQVVDDVKTPESQRTMYIDSAIVD